MTPLRQRYLEDLQLRGLAETTQRSYIHYVGDYARFYRTSPENLDREAVRQYELHLLHERKLSPSSINTFVAAVQFLYLTTLDRPWCNGPRFSPAQRAVFLTLIPAEAGGIATEPSPRTRGNT